MALPSITLLILFLSSILLLHECQADLEHNQYLYSTPRQSTATSKSDNIKGSLGVLRSFNKHDVITEDKNDPNRNVTVEDSTVSFRQNRFENGGLGHIKSKVSSLHFKSPQTVTIEGKDNCDSHNDIKHGRKRLCRQVCTRCFGHDVDLINTLCHRQCVHRDSGRQMFKNYALKQLNRSKCLELLNVFPINKEGNIAVAKDHFDAPRRKTEEKPAGSREITHILKREVTRHIFDKETTQPVKRNMCRSVCTLCERMGSAGVATSCQRHCVQSPMESDAFEYCLNLWLQNRT